MTDTSDTPAASREPRFPAIRSSLRARTPRPVAYLFDLDGVLTPTAELHRRAWKRTFDEFFAHLAWRGVGRFAPLDDADYFAHIDGRPRYEGVRAILNARGIALPARVPGSGPGFASVEALGDLKQEQFQRALATGPIAPFPGVIELLDALDGVPRAVVSSSANAREVLAAAGLLARFPVIVDGLVARRSRLAGKPNPATFEFACSLLDVPVGKTCVLEDAVAGVAAAAAGGFGLVVGVDRGAGETALRRAGADVVVRELDELLEPTA